MSGSQRLAASGMALFCLATLLFTAVRDVWLPHTRDVEVWGGLEVHGVWARTTAPLHWAVFATGAWGFWRGWPWIWSAAAGYAFYVAVSHLIWNLTSAHGGGWPAGLAQLVLFSAPALLLLWGRPQRSV